MATRETATDHDDEPRGFASPPCFMHEVDPAYMGLAVPETPDKPSGAGTEDENRQAGPEARAERGDRKDERAKPQEG